MKKILGLVVMIGLLAMSTQASDNITIPNTFSSGSTISSSQMNENFSRLIELLDNQSKTINNLENKINFLISEHFTEFPRYVTLNYLNGDRGNCGSNSLNFISTHNQCQQATNSNREGIVNFDVNDENDPQRPQGCYLYSGGWIYLNNGTGDISSEAPRQYCMDPNPSL